MSDELLQFLGIEERPILTQFIEEVANKGLQQYQKVIQWGEHHGQSLYNHIVSGVFLIHSLQEILQLREDELKTLTIAFCIHDLNKTYQGKETHYIKIMTSENAAQEIEKIGFDSFFPDWRDYIEDIVGLDLGHSRHNRVNADYSIDRRSPDRTRLGKKRIKELTEVISAVDVADLSQSYSERQHKQTFLSCINAVTPNGRQYRLIAHQVTEHRGLLTNIIHNLVANFLKNKFNALPVFLYVQGTHYLVSSGIEINLTDKDKVLIGELVEQKINQMKSDEYSKFIKPSNQGIKIDEELLKLGVSCIEIFAHVSTIIQRKSYKLEETEVKFREKLTSLLGDKNTSEGTIIRTWLEKSRITPANEELMRLGELLRTFYIFLKKHCTQSLIDHSKIFRDPWVYLYQILEIQETEQYSVFDPLYERAYIVAKDLILNYENLKTLIVQKASFLVKEEQEQEENISDGDEQEEDDYLSQNLSSIVSYVRDNISFDFTTFSLQGFTRNLEVYIQNNHQQSCYASSTFETSKWMSGNVPRGIKVQQFSNRLICGQREPKRYIDPIVREQFSLEKLNYESGKEKTIYLHLMPYSFMTAPFIESFRKIFAKFQQIDVSAVSLSIKEAIKFFDANKATYFVLPIKPQKASGILLPKYSEIVGNVISLPLNPIGDNKTEKYLTVIEYAFLIHKRFGVKVLLSELVIPVLNLTEHKKTDIFLDGVPSTLQGLVTSENLYFRRNTKEAYGSGDIVWQRLHAIREMYDLLWTDSKENELVAMAQAFAGSENKIFFVVDRLIEKRAEFEHKRKKIDKEVAARSLTRKLKIWMEQAITTGSNV